MEINKGCYECKHHCHGRLMMIEDDIPPRCMQGHDADYEKWWNDNSTNTDRDKLTPMPCCELSDASKQLDALIEQTSEFLETLRYK